MLNIQNFSPEKTYVMTASAAGSTPVAITQPTTEPGALRLVDFRVHNAAGVAAYLNVALSGTATAVVDDPASIPIAAGATETFNFGAIKSAAAILASGTSAGKIYITAGNGS